MLRGSKAWERWYRRALPAYWVFLFCATHFPKPKLPSRVPATDKLAHFVAFGVLAFLFWRFAESFERKLSARFVWLALIGLGLYAGADEYLQQFVHRHTSWADWFANLAGLVVVLIVLEWRRRTAASSPAAGPNHPKT